jgi:hypothetical protein
MPKKKHQESQAQQSERFQRKVADLVNAGKLSPIEADHAMDAIVKAGAKMRLQTSLTTGQD